MQKITFTNAKGQSLEISNKNPFVLTEITGLGELGADLQRQTSLFQDGSTFIDAFLEERGISIGFVIKGMNQDEIQKKRLEISSILNPKLGEGTLIYENSNGVKVIQAISEHIPTFPNGSNNKGATFQRVILDFICPNPYFRNIVDEKTEIAFWEPQFEFPLEITGEGIEMGIRSPSLIVNVLNDGHVDTGMIIKFRALGTVVNPSLVNVNTGESFKINRTLTAGEIITVNTNSGKKRIESTLNGVTTNIFNNIVFGSTFLQLEIGDNLFRYDADQYLEALEVDIYHSPQFVGV